MIMMVLKFKEGFKIIYVIIYHITVCYSIELHFQVVNLMIMIHYWVRIPNQGLCLGQKGSNKTMKRE